MELYKGTDKVIGSVDFNHRHEDDVLESCCHHHTYTQTIGVEAMCREAAKALIDLAFKELWAS